MMIISPSSMMVMVLMGRLKTVPKQAHCIFFLFITDCNTPIRLTDMTIAVNKLVNNGMKSIKNMIPKANSI